MNKQHYKKRAEKFCHRWSLTKRKRSAHKTLYSRDGFFVFTCLPFEYNENLNVFTTVCECTQRKLLAIIKDLWFSKKPPKNQSMECYLIIKKTHSIVWMSFLTVYQIFQMYVFQLRLNDLNFMYWKNPTRDNIKKVIMMPLKWNKN